MVLRCVVGNILRRQYIRVSDLYFREVFKLRKTFTWVTERVVDTIHRAVPVIYVTRDSTSRDKW